MTFRSDFEYIHEIIDYKLPTNFIVNLGMRRTDRGVILLFSLLFLIFILCFAWNLFIGNYTIMAHYLISLLICSVFLKSRIDMATTRANYIIFFLSMSDLLNRIEADDKKADIGNNNLETDGSVKNIVEFKS